VEPERDKTGKADKSGPLEACPVRRNPLHIGTFLMLAGVHAKNTQEELLPLLVLYAPNSMPSTTILPAQLIRIKDEEQTRRRAALVAYAKSVVDPLPSTSVISSLPANSVSQLCKILELGTFAPVALQRRRLRKHLEFLSKDDEMLRNEIGDIKQELSIEEKRLALAERGMCVFMVAV
jgi:LETM1 and EF-hand domain-containing protein 1